MPAGIRGRVPSSAPGRAPVPRIKAITFDLWDTIVHDDSDEPKRKERGLPTKRDHRRQLLWEALNRHAPIARATVDLAFDVADAAFNKVWREHSITWLIGERIQVALKGLGRTLPDADFAALVNALGRMEIDIPPDAIPGVKDALAELSRRYRLAIVSDAIVTPGANLRKLLELHGLREYFTGFAFSDEVGHSKPHRSMFEAAARQMGVALEEMVHVGDRDHNDVKGPQALGMKAVLFVATRDADRAKTSADAICESYRDLPATIDRLAASESSRPTSDSGQHSAAAN
ncbi:MAG: HAD family hydrolase [Rhodospirillales bacterium]|nr:HAD family hydrolase [Rhodospirillales bacterium]